MAALPRLLVDASHTAAHGHYTGIQRYVRRTVRHAAALLGPGEAGALGLDAGGAWTLLPALPTHPKEVLPALALGPAGRPAFTHDTHVLLADRFWHTQAWPALDALVRSPATLSVVVYDLLALRHPAWFASGHPARFERFLRTVLPRARHVVCLSEVVRRDVDAWCRDARVARGALHVVPPGHVVWDGAPQRPAALPAQAAPFVLQVGTIEPRKNHRLTLDAMQALWAAGSDARLLLVGQAGWLMDGFLAQLRALPQWGDRLLWLADASDAELAWCYRHAAAVVYPSAGEGYGLPPAEATAAGAPVVVADTPIHREVMRQLPPGAVRLIDGQDARALAAVLREQLARRPRGEASETTRARTWRTATAELLQAIGLHAPQTV